MKNKILFYLGLFLIVDGLLSIYFGKSCLNSCVNNNDFGNVVRILRAVIGGYLVKLGK